METEIKLLFKDPEDLLAITSAGWFDSYCKDKTPESDNRLINTYFDTPDRRLNDRKAVVRVRTYDPGDNARYEHTVKYGGAVVNGLHQRYEWNMPSDSSSFSSEAFIDSVSEDDDPLDMLKEVLEGIKDEELVPLCSVEFTRKIYIFRSGGSTVEACIDIGEIRSGEASEDICELELELKSGDISCLMEMAGNIMEQTGSVTFDESKYHRALRLHDSVKGNG